MEEHITSRKTYLFVFLALLVLLAATVGAAFVNLGPFNLVLALIIAGVKAALVVLFFMHVRSSDSLTRIFAAAGLIWLLILVGLTLTDYLTRSWDPTFRLFR
jgi:cytochrome c oxidase subunit 4